MAECECYSSYGGMIRRDDCPSHSPAADQRNADNALLLRGLAADKCYLASPMQCGGDNEYYYGGPVIMDGRWPIKFDSIGPILTTELRTKLLEVLEAKP